MPGVRDRVLSCGVAGAMLLALLTGCGQDAPPPDLPLRAIAWQRVSSMLSGQERVISGIVTAIEDTRLAFEVGGTVETVEVNLGDVVEKNHVLARLDPEPFELAVRDAEAGRAQAQALRAQALSTYERFAEVANTGAISQQELDRSVAMRDSRQSQFEAAVARLNLARRDLRRSVLVAPFNGSISSRDIDPAMKVASGQTAFQMDSTESGLRVEVQMPETLIPGVRQGAAAKVSFPSIGDVGPDLVGERFAAVVSEVGTRAGVGNSFPVRANLLAPPPGLRPGMTAEVTFALALDELSAGFEGFMVPVAAALAEQGSSFSVFVYDSETSTVSKRSVRTGGVRGNSIAILDGLAEGEIIAIAGVSFLRDGQQVTLLDEQLIQAAQ
jgi:multidrug efflux system membrane fusion protein